MHFKEVQVSKLHLWFLDSFDLYTNPTRPAAGEADPQPPPPCIPVLILESVMVLCGCHSAVILHVVADTASESHEVVCAHCRRLALWLSTDERLVPWWASIILYEECHVRASRIRVICPWECHYSQGCCKTHAV